MRRQEPSVAPIAYAVSEVIVPDLPGDEPGRGRDAQTALGIGQAFGRAGRCGEYILSACHSIAGWSHVRKRIGGLHVSHG